MNAARLLEHYERIADAPDAITRLRRFILDLAVRGRLVPQDPSDEPASKLLKRIAAEKARSLKSGDIRKPRDLDDGRTLDEPFGIPAAWAWVRLDAVGAIIGGGTPSATEPENFAEPGNGIPWLTPADLGRYSESYVSRGARDLSEKGFRSSSATIMPAGTVLFTSRAPIGYVAIAANLISTNQGFKSILPYVRECSRFIATAMKAFAPDIDAKAPGTTFKEVSGKIIAALPFPLPPLAEQGRIVARFDELTALCDKLETTRAKREAARDVFTAASFARLNAPDPDPVAFAGHARSALESLKPLTTRRDQMKHLRQTILNLAVRGKLVPQEPNDEPASELLKQIASTRAQLIRAGLIRQTKTIAPLKAESAVFEVPVGWLWIHANEVWDFENGDRSKNYPSRDQLVERGIPFVNAGHLVGGRVSMSAMNFISQAKFEQLGGGKLRRGDQLYCLRGSLGKHATYDHDGAAAIASSLVILRPIDQDIAPYLAKYLDSDIANLMLRRFDNGSAQPNLSSANVHLYEIPLPPLAEQYRIVSKVDELMAVCDRLEASLAAGDNIRSRLLGAIVADVLATADREAA